MSHPLQIPRTTSASDSNKGKQKKEPQKSVGRSWHAEEVELADGVEAPRLSSTTGRQLHASKEADSHEPQYSTQSSSSAPAQPEKVLRTTAKEYRCLDSYGFRVSVLEKAAEERYAKENALPARTLKKWASMTASEDRWNSVSQAKKKKYCRKGIPQHLRQKVWPLLLGTYGSTFAAERRGRYAVLRDRPLDSEDVAGVIDRDLDRTFPTHYLFEEGGPRTGQVMLRNILRAYANYNSLAGYCQGMGFLAATLLLQIEKEEETFWAFCALMEKPPHQFEGLYEPGFPQLRCCFYVFEHLMAETKAKKVGQLLKQLSIEPSFYATHWFLTAFSYSLNFGLISRIWDMFLCEGWKPIYRIALSLMIWEEKRLLSQPHEGELLMALKTLHESKDPALLLKKALGVKFKTSRVWKLTVDFRLR